MFSKVFVWQLNFTSKRNRIPYILAIFSKLWITKPSRFILGDNSAETQVNLKIDFKKKIGYTDFRHEKGQIKTE